MSDQPTRIDALKNEARRLGFELCGSSPVDDLPELAHFSSWIAEGMHGEMSYLAKTNEAGELKRAAIANTAPWARAAVVCAINYNPPGPLSTDPAPPESGWISRYAWGADYHDLLLKRMRALESFYCDAAENAGLARPRTWCYVDTGPVVERVLARHAGLGWLGNNACLINEKLGSWLFLAVMLTSEALPSDAPAPARCGSCTRCIEACPTKAIVAPGRIDARRCLSYCTIEQRGQTPAELRSAQGRHVYGCDICQEVCPWNRRAPVTGEPFFMPRTQVVNPSLRWISGINKEQHRAAYQGMALRRAKLEGLQRSAAVALGNSGVHPTPEFLQNNAASEDAILSEQSQWAIEQLRSKD